MSDMFALGAPMADQPTPGAFLLLPFYETPLDYFLNPTVSIPDDSETFQNLLSFIYPNKTSAVFTSLDALLPVLDAANKYQMRVVVDALKAQIMSRSVSGKTYREALLYDDPLRVYAKAKELNLSDLVDAAANATLNIDIMVTPVPDAHSDVASMPATWLWQLLDIRKERTAWLLSKCGHRFNIGLMDSKYQILTNGLQFRHFQTFRCGCDAIEDDVFARAIPASLLDKVKANPCPRAIRKIDFNVELRCLRCGAAVAVHFNSVCKEYEEAFGVF